MSKKVKIYFFGTNTGMWYMTNEVHWPDELYQEVNLHNAFKKVLNDNLNFLIENIKSSDAKSILRELDVVCPEPHHLFSYPICLKNGEWID